MLKSVLILGCDDRSGLAVIRSLGRAGIAVDVAWVTQRSAVKSRYVRNTLNLPDPNDASESWLDALKSLLTKFDYNLVLPCDDRAIISIQRHAAEIGKLTSIYTLTSEAFSSTFDKYQTTLLAEQCGIPLPRWAIVRSPREIASARNGFTLPVVLKPVSSFSLESPNSRREVRTICEEKDFVPVLRKMLNDGPVEVQAFFRGQGVGVELLVRDGHVLTAFQHERVHEPPAGGGSSYRRSAPLDLRLLKASKDLVASIRYTGVIMIEFRVNPENGNWILVEANGRFWGSLPLAIVSGVNFPLYLYQMLIEGRLLFPTNYKIGIYCRHLRLDLSWFKKNFTANRSDPTLNIVPLSRVCTEFKNILTLSEHVDTFALDDPWPFFTELGDLTRRAIKNMVTHAAHFVGYSRLLKAIRSRRARKQLRGAAMVTFVCYGNICRSPFAEAFARSIAPNDISFFSAGTLQKAFRRPPEEACIAAKRVGIRLEEHRSRILSEKIIETSDVIIVFDRQNLEDVSRRFPHAKSRIVRLSDFLPGADDEIVDPYNQSDEQFEHCYRRIANSLSQLWAPTNDTKKTF